MSQSAGGEINEQKADETPQLLLRTYRASDHDHVDHLFYSEYFTLVPEGVKCKLMSPVFWLIWALACSLLLAFVPIIVAGMDWPKWTHVILQVFFVLAITIFSFAFVFFITDRLEAVDRIEQVRQNDLKDPEIYYLNWIKEEVEIKDEKKNEGENSGSPKKRVTFDKDAKLATEIVRTQKPENEQSPSHFWVLTLDNRLCGMIGVAHCNQKIMSNRPAMPPGWKLVAAAAFRRYNIKLPESLKDLQSKTPVPVFAEAHEPKVASLQRLTVRYEYQDCSLSTLLITRAMSWANEKGLERIEAVTNEFETKAEAILREQHGFKVIKKERIGWFGQYKKTLSCNVKEWMKTHEEGAKTYKKE